MGGQSSPNDASKVLQQSPPFNILKIKLEKSTSRSQGTEGQASGGVNNNNSIGNKSHKALPVRGRGFKTEKAQWPTLVEVPDRRPDMPPISSRLQTPIVSSSGN